METPPVRSRGRPRKRRREDLQNEENNKGVVNEVVCNHNNDNGNKGDSFNREEVQNMGNPRKRGRPPKKRVVEVRGEAIVGRYVMKEFEGSGVFLGKIVSYDSGLYRVDYEDGDCEDLDSGELREFLVADERQKFVGVMLERKKKLDEQLGRKMGSKLKDEQMQKLDDDRKLVVRSKDELEKGIDVEVVCALEKVDAMRLMGEVDVRDAGNVPNEERKIEVPGSGEVPNPNEEVNVSEVNDDEDDDNEDYDDDDDDDDDEDYAEDDDEDASSDWCEYGQGWETRAETELPAVPPPDLPPSSGTVGVPEEYVSHLFSVYGFLRTFSIRLFLSPFTLDDLVGCLKCTVPNTLLDAIHVALLRALRRHLETLSSDGSQLASKCLRSIDWSMLDILTWPVYLVHYLMAFGHLNGKEWKGFYVDVLEKDYCTLSIGTKLMVLQILCDDALDTEEIRAEIDTREESEVGVDSDGISSSLLESGPRKVYPRCSKISMGKDRDNVNLGAESSPLISSKAMQINDHNRDTDVDEDGNGDECRLCGMEGMLICCDGCPSAYHSRCIGVNKLSIPEGEWFCPECTISKLGPPITMGTSLRGAVVFGVDSFAQLFLGTCNHLLVLKVSVKTSPFVRYYNCNDIPGVLRALCSSPNLAVFYLGICQAISKYWELPQVVLPSLLNSQTSMGQFQTQSGPSGEIGSQKVLNKVELGSYGIGVGESFVNDVSGLSTEKLFPKSGPNDVSYGVPVRTDLRSIPSLIGGTVKGNSTNMTNEPSEQTEFSQITQVPADRSSITGFVSCTSVYNTSSSAGQKNGVCLPETHYMRVKENSNKTRGRAVKKWKDTCLYFGSIFKPLAYINHYVHGDFAASAATNFAVLSSDENRASEVHSSDPRKAMAANVMLQARAFSSAAVRFFWPSTEKKLIEIPRERCSWCLHCKAPVTSKKACLLNQAALNATRAEMKFISGLRLVKNVEGGLCGIAAYTLFMEESLRGLILGPYRSSVYREQWRRKVEQASTCSEMKSLLLDLERNLCTIAFSSEWTKFVDNWMDESSVPQSACTTGSTQKRAPGRRKKHLSISEVTADDSNDSSNDSIWWRGGKLATLVFQKGTFPCSVLRKAARQGGSRRLPGIYYAEGSDVPKRSRQFIWRAAVEMAKNASQLALQVRYMDQYIKWSDLVRPEQSSADGKGPETDALAFRNAQICDKKVFENKVMYGVAFGHQKHLSTRLMKSIIEKEESPDGKDKYWFSETRIPLYLTKEYEENAEKFDLPPPEKPDRYTKHQKRQLKASRKEIFIYLARKRDNLYMCPCASCHRDVLLGAEVTCSSCEGYCHSGCTSISTVQTNEGAATIVTCKQCSHGKSLIQNNSTVESPTSPLAMQGQEFQNSVTAAKSARLKITSQHHNSASVAKSLRLKSASQRTLESRSEKKLASSDSNSTKSKKRPLHWGLIWKKKRTDDGSDFLSKNILLRGLDGVNSLTPVCHLCQKPYSPHLMYILCDTCNNWYHADAVELDESKLPNLLGYKCCRCRRIKSPVCPYADLNLKNTEVKKIRIKGPKEEKVEANSASGAISEQAESLPSTPMSAIEMDMETEEDVFIQVDDPFLLSVSQVEQMPEAKAEVDFEWSNHSGPAPQKLPVRRHIKNEKDDDGLNWSDFSAVQCPKSVETENIANAHAGWDVCNGGLEDGTKLDSEILNYENTDYEPQTYFSFTELLEADDGNQLQGVDASADGWENLPCEYSQSGFMEQCEVGSFDDHALTAPTRSAIDGICDVCEEAPAPDLTCRNCKIQIHSHCSPWEEVPQKDNWTCGTCRAWRL